MHAVHKKENHTDFNLEWIVRVKMRQLRLRQCMKVQQFPQPILTHVMMVG
jgi:hypothetical protein